ncbi:glycosyltransferase family 2 protein [bacterium]|nr:glycosyltransferase family 2 protein [bacterium]
MKDLVSVVIPVFNGESSVLRAVNSVLSQTYTEIEVIVVDDLSTDGTWKLLEEIQDSRVKVLRVDKKVSASYVRNRGINNAKGKFVAFLDDDDEWMSEKVEKQLKFLQTNSDYGTVLCNFGYVYPGGTEQVYSVQSKDYVKDILLMEKKFAAGSSMFVRKDLLMHLGMFDDRFQGQQDLEMLIRLGQASKIGFIPEKLLRINGSSGRVIVNVDRLISVKEMFLNKFKDVIEQYPKSVRNKVYARHWLQVARMYAVNGQNQESMQYLKRSLREAFLFSNLLLITPFESYFVILFYLLKNAIFRKNKK